MFEDGVGCEADEVGQVTQANPGQPDPNRVCKNRVEYPFDETTVKKNFRWWDGNFGSTSQTYGVNGGTYDKISKDDVEKYGLSCRELLALADSGGRGGRFGGGAGQTQQSGKVNLICDLNWPPQTVAEMPGLSLQFTPLTPDQTKRARHKHMEYDMVVPNENQRINLASENDVVEVNQHSMKGLTEEVNLNETPQPKQRRRKHRPKVVTEGKPKRGRKPATAKPPDGSSSSTGKRNYVRRKGVEKSPATPASPGLFESHGTGGVIHPSPDRQTKKTCKRKIDFDVVVDKTCTMTSEVVENYQKVHETESLSPINPVTPSKTELPQARLERNFTKAKCKINFLNETHDKAQIHVPYPNEPGCCTSEINEIKLLREHNMELFHDSLESYLSMFTDYRSGMFPIFATDKKKAKARGMSKDRYMQTCDQNSKRKRIMVHHSMVPCMYHAHLGYNPNFRHESIYDIDTLIHQFEHLHISRHAVVPGYHEKNALVVYQQDKSLVPYVRKKKQRPKVDLDDETNRVWMLLLEDINSEGIDGTDEDKAKWWEEERRVFRGRADSFIARMHLVQGDRRFSQWKGSVLDSVVGVFLTQNVSDHLSSSAFMSLAAQYPLNLNTSSEVIHESGDHDPIPMILQEGNSFEEKEVIDSNEFSKNCVVSDNSECEVVELTEKDSAMSKESVINHIEVDETSSSHISADTCSMCASEEQKDSYKASISFVELLHMQGPTRVYERKIIQKNSERSASEESGISTESASQTTVQMVNTVSSQESTNSNFMVEQVLKTTKMSKASEINIIEASQNLVQKVVDFDLNKSGNNRVINGIDEVGSKVEKVRTREKDIKVDWDSLRLQAEAKQKRERTPNTMDSMDYEAIRAANVNDVAEAIKERGMNNRLAERIKDMLDRLVRDHGSTDLEWLRDIPPDKAKEYLLSFKGLGLKSVECIRLLTLQHLAFPVDTNVGRIAVRLGWVPLQALPESLQLHLLELYPIQESIQKYLWPRLCKLDQRTLYELHYQMITFGKVFCTKTKPNCNACPLRGECRHFASAFASARLALPAPEESIANSTENKTGQNPIGLIDLPSTSEQSKQLLVVQNCNPVIEEPTTPEPIVEVPASPEPEQIQQDISDIEDFGRDIEEIPTIKLNIEEFTQNLQTYMERHMELGEGDMSKALVALTSEAASIPTPKLKNVNQLRTEHHVYELPDSHPLLEGLDTREADDPCSYLLAIWTPGETADSIQPPEGQCCSQESGTLCNEEMCVFCNSTREANSQIVRGTLLIPCRTAMRGSFPLNGTYFQVNEVFADHDSSLSPIDVPRAWLWNLPRRTVYFGSSIPTIFKGLTTEEIQYCFWRGFVCVRGFDRKKRAPRPLRARLHCPASRLKKSTPMTDEKGKLKQ
ncbi:hypothetical protein R6Q59_002198 [Mikania micrantha]